MNEPAAPPTVHIVIVTYNSADDIGQCLRAIETTTEAAYTVTVVDNASVDATLEVLASDHPEVSVLQNVGNVGFAAAVNRGASGTIAPWLLLINPDLIVHPGCIDQLLAAAEQQPESGVYTGQTFGPEGHSDTMSIWGFPTMWSATCFALGLDHFLSKSRVFNPESLGPERNMPRNVPAVSGALCLIRTELWEQLGGYDERFVIYGEDIDLSFRSRRLGVRPRYEPQAEATHQRGKSTSSAAVRRVLVLLGKATFVRAHSTRASARVQLALMSIGVLLRATVDSFGGRSAHTSQWILAWRAKRTWVRGWPTQTAFTVYPLTAIVRDLENRLAAPSLRATNSRRSRA